MKQILMISITLFISISLYTIPHRKTIEKGW